MALGWRESPREKKQQVGLGKEEGDALKVLPEEIAGRRGK